MRTVAAVGLLLAFGAAGLAAETEGQVRIRVSWGHSSHESTAFHIQLIAQDAEVFPAGPLGLEAGETCADGVWQTQAGGGDVDGVEFLLRFASRNVEPAVNVHSIWNYLLEHTDADAASRLRLDPACRPDPRRLTVRMNEEATRGFSLTVDQLLTTRTFWIPELDMFVSAADPPVAYAAHLAAIEPFRGKRTLDRLRREPEATYEQYAARWEDMGNPAFQNPHQTGPGHIVGVTWDSAVPKFGIDRGAGVWPDYGNPDKFRLWCDLGDSSPLNRIWRSQRLADGLPVVTTVLEKEGVTYEFEQFAYPLHGPPLERRGDVPMVLLQKITLRNLQEQPRSVTLRLHHQRTFPGDSPPSVRPVQEDRTLVLELATSGDAILCLQGEVLPSFDGSVHDDGAAELAWSCDLPARGSQQLLVKLPSPTVRAADRGILQALDYATARSRTIEFWSNYLSRGALFVVPEQTVNDLFRANLWHALRLPRRRSAPGANLEIDLPYSNFAYAQDGTPWPVNQAVYVDYMLYDRRGYHEISAEELAVMFRNNQEPDGHVGGFANWGVYTPSMIYCVAQHYRLSQDRASFERLLPPTLKALDWCLEQLRLAREKPGPAAGLIRAPLNDLSHDAQAWAFNQAYCFAGLDALGVALADVGHPRADECRQAARELSNAIARGFGHASLCAPLVQLRDRTWIPYVPSDALAPRRLLEIWYPTDVDSGPLHLARLQALDPRGPLTTYLLHDHEDNLFLRGWGMANEPVYNQHATALLLRDEVPAAIRAFYSMMACAFSHSALEPVEHRWAWGQYFGPPSTDGAWFDLYRHMLIHERDDGALLLLQATPRKWLADGQRIRVERAPSFYGPLSIDVLSRAAQNEIRATVGFSGDRRPQALLLRLRHPAARAPRRVTVNGQSWTDFDPTLECVRIASPADSRYVIAVQY